jgi:hypothetical protein
MGLGAMEHIRVSATDRFLSCAQQLLGKPVYRSAAVFRGGSGPGSEVTADEIAIPCGVSPEEFLTALAGSRSEAEPEEIRVLDAGNAIFLCPRRMWLRAAWRRVSIELTAEDWKEISGSRNLDARERAEVLEAVARDARTVPLVAPITTDANADSAKIRVLVRVDAHRLAGGVESIVAVIAQEFGGPGRLVYGEKHDGRYVGLWDSPLFRTGYLRMGYQDVDGDGREEILVNATIVGASGRDPWQELSIWSAAGQELTRQDWVCAHTFGHGYSAAGGACPISAATIEVDPVGKGKADIVVSGWDDGSGQQVQRPRRYRLLQEKYVVAKEHDARH